MSEQPNASDAQATPVPCAKCGSTIHTTGHHEGGAPERKTDGGMSPMGHHEGGITGGTATTAKPATTKGGMSPMGHHEGGITGGVAKAEDDEKKPAGVATGHHEGGSPGRK
jgi:hypothetical protein